MANKHDHARQAFGALVDGGLATPANQIPLPFNKEIAAGIIQLDVWEAMSAFGELRKARLLRLDARCRHDRSPKLGF
jgi:hypothetical protein